MEQSAIFGDVHGNLPVLEAVLADMDSRGLKNRYCLGERVGCGVFPNEVIALIREQSIHTIMGNYDLGVGNDSAAHICRHDRGRRRLIVLPFL